MADASDRDPFSATLGERAGELFPSLTPAQIARVAARGHLRRVERGEVLVEQGERSTHFFVVTEGEVEIIRLADGKETLITTLRPGMFTGEVNMLSGRRVVVQIRASAPGEVIDVDHDHLLTLIQTDGELGEILLRTFVLRRLELIAQGFGDVVLVGSNHSAGTLRIKEFLTRNNHPYAFVDLDRDDSVQDLLDRFQISVADVPVLICRGKTVLRNPGNPQIADCLGFNEALDPAQIRDALSPRKPAGESA